MLPRRTSERPQRVLQPLGQRYVALPAEDHVRMLEARAGEAEVIEPMIERDAGDADRQVAHLGKIRQPHPPGLMHLAEDDLALGPMQRAPGPDPSLERPADIGVQSRMPSLQFLKDRHRP
jgi:hypothetical protein